MTKGQGGTINLVWICQSRPGEQGMRRVKMHNSNLDELGANTQMLNVYVRSLHQDFYRSTVRSVDLSRSLRVRSLDYNVDWSRPGGRSYRGWWLAEYYHAEFTIVLESLSHLLCACLIARDSYRRPHYPFG